MCSCHSMWCTFKAHKHIPAPQLAALRAFLTEEQVQPQFGDDDQMSGSSDGEGSPKWDAWEEKEGEDTQEDSVSWLEDCLVSIGPDAQSLVLARSSNIAFLHAKSTHDSEQYSVGCKTQLNPNYGHVTCIFCLPVAGSQQTLTKAYDWLCVVVGTTLGYLLFYTEHGAMIMQQRFSMAEVRSVDFGVAVHAVQQLSVLYSDCMVCVQGLSLYTGLRAARGHAARGAPIDQVSEMVDFEWSKWKPNECCLSQGRHLATGVSRETAVDQLMAASLNIGFYANTLKPATPLYATYCIASVDPFLSFYWHEDGTTFPALSDAIYGLADKVKSSMTSQIPSFLNIWGSSKSQSKAKPNAVEVRAVGLPVKNAVFDESRTGVKLVPSPKPGLFLVTDSLARVCLVNAQERRVLRMWKGYRDAECGWIEVKEEGTDKKVVFVVLLAPRRSIVEVWPAGTGARVAAFNVMKGGRLVVPNTSHVLGSGSGQPTLLFHNEDEWVGVLYISPDGSVSRLEVPIHLALKDMSISDSHDTNVLHQLQRILDNLSDGVEGVSDDVTRLCQVYATLKQPAAMKKGADMVVVCDKLDILALARVFDVIIEWCESTRSDGKKIQSRRTSSNMSMENRMLWTHTLARKQLLNAFALINMNWQSDARVEYPQVSVHEMLHMDEETMAMHMKPIQFAHSLRSSESVKTESIGMLKFAELLDCYDLSTLYSSINTEYSHFMRFALKRESKWVGHLGEMILRPYLQGEMSLTYLRGELLPQLGLDHDDLLHLVCLQWLGVPHLYSTYPPLLYDLLYSICSELPSEKWIETVVSSLLSSTFLSETLSLCIVVRAVVISLSNNTHDNSSNQDNWNVISMEVEKWNVLLTHFNALLWLHNLVSTEPHKLDPPISISLQCLLDHGKGYYREVVAQWVSQAFITPQTLLQQLEHQHKSGWEECMHGLRVAFPVSLQLEMLLCDCCMEQASQWDKDADNLDRLAHCIDMLDAIDGHVLKHGMTHIIWDMFLCRRMQRLTLLVEKVGKTPKDRLARKDVGLGELRLPTLTYLCSRLLCVMRQTNSEFVDFSQVLQLSFEDSITALFNSHFPLARGASITPLAHLASKKKCTNFLMVDLHVELSLVLHVMLSVPLTCRMRPLSVFDSRAQSALFQPFTDHPLLNLGSDVHPTTIEHRVTFLNQVVQVALTDKCDLVVRELNELATAWDGHHSHILQSALSYHTAVHLFATGNHAQATKIVPTVHDREKLGNEVLSMSASHVRIALGQLKDEMGEKQVEEVTQLASPTLLHWLDRVSVTYALHHAQTCKESVATAKNLLSQTHLLLSHGDSHMAIVSELDELMSRFPQSTAS